MTATRHPLATILINNYNYARFLPDAIESALDQSYSNKQVIVVDDGSTDNSLDVIARYTKHVRLISKENGGQASAFNCGYAASQGDILFFLDADDLFRANKVRNVVELYATSPDAGWIFDRLTAVGPSGFEELGLETPQTQTELEWGFWDVRHSVESGVMPYIPTATSGLSFRRLLLSSILPMPESICITSDNYIKFCSLALSTGLMLEESFTLQRIHGSNAYTHERPGKLALKGMLTVRIAMALYYKAPQLRHFALNLLVPTLAQFAFSTSFTSQLSGEVKAFLSHMGTADRYRFIARVAYRAARLRLKLAQA